jgi:Aspartate/tyrosine/aromatic aminotransferase
MTVSTPLQLTIFTEMTQLALAHNAINLSQGFPDFEADSHFIDAMNQAMRSGYNQYAPMAGNLSLRECLAHQYNQQYQISIHPDTDITITPGATYAIYVALASVVQSGDEVIILEPAYDSYKPNIIQLGAIPIPISLQLPDFSIPWDIVAKKINSKTKAIIINTPHNPTGYVWTKSDFEQLAALAQQHSFYIISDEVYEQITYDHTQHYSVLQFPELAIRSFAIYSFGKTLHVTGWKMGYVVACKPLMDLFKQIHQYIGFSCHHPTQIAIDSYLRNYHSRELIQSNYQQKRDYFIHQLKSTPFEWLKPAEGSYFQLVSYKNISSLPDKEFCYWLTQEIKVAAIPLSSFYTEQTDHQFIRFCFAKKIETLDRAFEQLRKINYTKV